MRPRHYAISRAVQTRPPCRLGRGCRLSTIEPGCPPFKNSRMSCAPTRSRRSRRQAIAPPTPAAHSTFRLLLGYQSTCTRSRRMTCISRASKPLLLAVGIALLPSVGYAQETARTLARLEVEALNLPAELRDGQRLREQPVPDCEVTPKRPPATACVRAGGGATDALRWVPAPIGRRHRPCHATDLCPRGPFLCWACARDSRRASTSRSNVTRPWRACKTT